MNASGFNVNIVVVRKRAVDAFYKLWRLLEQKEEKKNTKNKKKKKKQELKRGYNKKYLSKEKNMRLLYRLEKIRDFIISFSF